MNASTRRMGHLFAFLSTLPFSWGFQVSTSGTATTATATTQRHQKQQQQQQQQRTGTMLFLLLKHSSGQELDESELDDTVSSVSISSHRRTLLQSGIATSLSFFSSASSARADPLSAESTDLPIGLLESRVLENVLSPPPYGLEGSDIFYPSWFTGSWNVYSECTDVLAPCGIALFGGNRTYNTARADMGPSKALRYESRFLLAASDDSSAPSAIADREFNVKSLVKVVMGPNSVLDIPVVSPNKFSCILAPQGAPSLLRVDLIVLDRRQESYNNNNTTTTTTTTTTAADENRFDCSEVVREIVSPVDSSSSSSSSSSATSTMTRPNPILKEVETTSLYTRQPDGSISCRQRSATFLLPSQQDPMAFQMWQATRDRPIDVRYYNVTYIPKK